MSVYMVAQSAPPTIWCPEWCDMTETHLDNLEGFEGRVIHQCHWDDDNTRRPDITFGHSTLVTGETDETDKYGPHFNFDGGEWTIDEMEALVEFLARAVAVARAEEARTAALEVEDRG